MIRHNKNIYFTNIRWMKYLILCLFCICILSGCGFDEAGVMVMQDPSVSTEEAELSEDDLETTKKHRQQDEAEQDTTKKVYVQVNGGVVHPGVYQVDAGCRVFQVIELAGGFAEQANQEGVNLTRPVQDEMVIYVPFLGEETEEPVQDTMIIGETGGNGETEKALMDSDSDKIDLNTATKEMLMTLPGIGEAKAEAILAYRESKGGFTDPVQIMEIRGIKEAIYDKIKDKIKI